MAVADILRDIGQGVATGARAVGAVAAPLAQRTAEVVSGEAPQIDASDRQRAEKLEDEQINAKASILENQLALAQRYGTLTNEQQQQYADAIANLYNKPRHAQVLMEKLRKAIHPNGTFAQGPQAPLPNATPEGGTLAADEKRAESLAAAKYHARPKSPNSQYFDSYAQSLGLNDSSEMSPEQWETALKQHGNASRAPVQHHWTPVKFNGNLYMHDPATNQMLFRGSENEVEVHHGVQNVTQADGTILQIPVTTYTYKQSGKPIVDEDGNPIQTVEPDNHPSNPSSGESKPRNAQAGPPEPKPPQPKPKGVGGILPKKSTGAKPAKPAGVGGIAGARVVGSHGSPLLKSDQEQYTKVAEDANGATQALASATEAMKSPTASSDQELIYSWVRSNVQGAGRMTQAEFMQAASIGGLEQRAQNWWNMLATGRLSPEIEQMMFEDIKRGTKAKQDEAARLRAQVERDMGQNTGGQNTPPPPPAKNTPANPPNKGGATIPGWTP